VWWTSKYNRYVNAICRLPWNHREPTINERS
jgi:hypothetical protein